MFGSVVLDITIGLVFIFLLYSLLATVINEIIATNLSMRANNLKHAIERMLEDNQPRSLFSFLRKIWKRKASVYRAQSATGHFYRRPSVKYLARKGRMPSYIPPHVFSRTLLDLLRTKGTGTTELRRIKNALEGDFLDPESKEQVDSLLHEAQNDLTKFKALLEQWFDDTMKRASGWYKKKVQFMLFAIGLAIAFVFNASTIEIIGRLSVDKEARAQIVDLAKAYVQNNKIDFNADTLDTIYLSRMDSLLRIQKFISRDAEEASSVLALGWSFPDSLAVMKVDSVPVLQPVQKIVKSGEDIFILTFPSELLARNYRYYSINPIISDNTKPAAPEVYFASFDYLKYFFSNFLGYLITALAISLGAPFWFDLLSRFIQLRGSVQHPVSKYMTSSSGGVSITKREG